ncbi:MAG: hypothetical protein ACI8UR_002068 [Natronomonas sp.]
MNGVNREIAEFRLFAIHQHAVDEPAGVLVLPEEGFVNG